MADHPDPKPTKVRDAAPLELRDTFIRTELKRAGVWLGLICAIAVTVLLWKVIPVFETMFASVNMELPLPTRVVIGLSRFVNGYWWAVIAGAAALVAASLSPDAVEHCVAGHRSVEPGHATALAAQIRAGNGTATLKTASGGTLKAMMRGSDIVVMDDKGGTAVVTQANVYQSNGVIHVVDKVLLPA